MKESFVTQIVSYLQTHELINEHTVIVVPSERLISYLHKGLYEAYDKPVISPRIVTIDRWIQQLVPDPILEKTHLLFELYEIFRKDPVETGATSFDAFLTWGQILLNDFEEIDRYLIDPALLFKNLRDIREIENWSFNQEELSVAQLKFMAFWDKLKPYYYALADRLKDLGVTTKAKAYKAVAQNIDWIFEQKEKAQIVFAGFNALSEAEISIMNQLFKLGRGHILIDADTFYLNDPLHEAGQFQRVLLQRLGVKSLPFVADRLATKAMDVQLVECAQFTAQAQAIGFELTKIPANELKDTLVLLAHEQLISTMLEHIPAQIERANITIGLPLQQTVLKSWIDLQFRIQEAYIRRESKAIYYKEYIQFIHHPFLEHVLSEQEMQALYQLENTIIKFNWQFLDAKKFPKSPRLEQLYNYFFTPWKQQWKEALENIQHLNQLLDMWFPESAEMEQALIRKYAEVVSDLQVVFERDIPELNIGTFRNLFNQNWVNTSIAFYGNPLDGLQIMGLLETRGIDFKHVFVLGLNDGNMPPSNPIQTLIPMDLRRYFGLPTPREKQGLFAHHFYRLLHQCESLFITYASTTEGVVNSEPSRYIQQLRLELARVNKNITIRQNYLELGSNLRELPKRLEKSSLHLEAMNKLVESGITFSQIEKFLGCSQNYLYLYLMKFKDNVELEEELENSTTGSILHHVMENMYRPYISTSSNKQYLTPEILTALESKIPLYLDAAFKEIYSDDLAAISTGTNHVFYVVAQDMILNVLRKEKEMLLEHPEKPLQILDLEKELVVDVQVKVHGEMKSIRLKGVIDRVDQWGEEIRIIDYKSGSVDLDSTVLSKKPLPIDELVDSIVKQKQDHTKNHGLQLLLYSYLYYKFYHKFTRKTAIVSFMKTSHGPYYFETKGSLSDQELLELVDLILERVLNMMFDPELPFQHNPKSKYCLMCD